MKIKKIFAVFILTLLLLYLSSRQTEAGPGPPANTSQNTSQNSNGTNNSAHYQTTASKTTAVGNPQSLNGGLGGTNPLATYGLYLVNTLKDPKQKCLIVSPRAYGGYLAGFAYIIDDKYGDISCVPPLSNDNKPPCLGYANCIIYSVHTFIVPPGVLQCVNFVEAVAQATGHTFSTAGNAIDFKTRVPNGYTWIPFTNNPSSPNFPQAGDIAIWSDVGGGPGHIAIIIKPLGTTYIDEVEGNGKGGGEVDESKYPLNQNDYYGLRLEGWLRLK